MHKNISKPVKRIDASDKIGGYTKYIADMEFKDMLYAKTLRSDRARAKILSMDIPKLPEGYFIVDKNDVPGKNVVKIVVDDMPFFAEDTVNYIGEPILLVVGPKREEIINIISNIKITYGDIEPILSIEEAEKGEKISVYGKENLFANYKYSKGNIEEASQKAWRIYEREYETGYQEHIYLETQGVVGQYVDGRIKIYGSMQCPYFVKNAVLQALGWDEDKVQVIQTTTGGAFGGKEEYPSLITGQVAVAALKAKKPVRLIFDRNEDIECTTKRHPSKIKIKSYLDKDFRIIGMEANIKLDGGAYAGLSNVVLQRSIFAAAGAYNVENIKVNGKAFATNNIISGAYRGFGAPQTIFALEMHMDYIANELGINPLDFRIKNILKKGDSTSTGGLFRYDIMLPEIIDSAEKMSNYKEKFKKYSQKDSIKGIGFSLFFHGGGFTGSGERDFIKAKAKLKKYKDGKVEILISNVEMGQGTQTTLRKIVAYVLEIEMEKVIYENPDTDRVPDTGPTVASRTIMIVGKLLEEAAKEMKEKWHCSDEWEVVKEYKHPEGFKWNDKTFTGDAYNAYSWGANVVEVEVNPLTYEADVTGVWAVYDIGRAIDEKIIQGQIDGGITQGLGYAGIEVMKSKDGRLMQRTNTDYVIPTSKEYPRIVSKLVNNPYIDGPFGAKSAGELTFIGAPAAYASAVQNAVGHSIKQVPVTPEYLMEVIENEKCH